MPTFEVDVRFLPDVMTYEVHTDTVDEAVDLAKEQYQSDLGVGPDDLEIAVEWVEKIGD